MSIMKDRYEEGLRRSSASKTRSKNKTILILGEGKMVVLKGKVAIADVVGVTAEPEITEVVDDTVVYCYTIKEVK